MGDPTLDCWSVWRDPFKAPELGSCLKGIILGHPRIPDGEWVKTAVVVSVNKPERTVTTASGRTYRLFRVNPDYAAWCSERGIVDPFPYMRGGSNV
jgi:hypothetical protein